MFGLAFDRPSSSMLSIYLPREPDNRDLLSRMCEPDITLRTRSPCVLRCGTTDIRNTIRSQTPLFSSKKFQVQPANTRDAEMSLVQGVGLHRRSTLHIRARVCARMLHSQNMHSFFAMCFSHNAARMLRVRCVLCMRACACVCMVRVFCMKGRLPCY